MSDAHEEPDLVEIAAAWLREAGLSRRIAWSGILQERFGLSLPDCARAIRLSGLRKDDSDVLPS